MRDQLKIGILGEVVIYAQKYPYQEKKLILSTLLKVILVPLITGQLEILPELTMRRGTPVVITTPDTQIKALEANGWIIIDQGETADGTIFYCVQKPRAKL